MTPQERATLAEQILSNPLTDIILCDIEASAIEALVYAKTEQDRVEAQWRVRAARSFRETCLVALSSTSSGKGGIA